MAIDKDNSGSIDSSELGKLGGNMSWILMEMERSHSRNLEAFSNRSNKNFAWWIIFYMIFNNVKNHFILYEKYLHTFKWQRCYFVLLMLFSITNDNVLVFYYCSLYKFHSSLLGSLLQFKVAKCWHPGYSGYWGTFPKTIKI